jgi:lysozyme
MKTKHKIAAGGGLSAAGAALAVLLIPHWEGRDYVAKHFSFDPPGVVTVCNGITNYDRPSLKAGQKFTAKQCDDMLLEALPRYAAEVSRCIPSFPTMPPHRQAALVSFTYNVGAGNLCKGSVAREFNAGNVAAACNAMVAYVKANGKTLKGLVNRRADGMWGERPWCLRED